MNTEDRIKMLVKLAGEKLNSPAIDVYIRHSPYEDTIRNKNNGLKEDVWVMYVGVPLRTNNGFCATTLDLALTKAEAFFNSSITKGLARTVWLEDNFPHKIRSILSSGFESEREHPLIAEYIEQAEKQGITIDELGYMLYMGYTVSCTDSHLCFTKDNTDCTQQILAWLKARTRFINEVQAQINAITQAKTADCYAYNILKGQAEDLLVSPEATVYSAVVRIVDMQKLEIISYRETILVYAHNLLIACVVAKTGFVILNPLMYDAQFPEYPDFADLIAERALHKEVSQ